ncbi:hypothetical protein MKZ38_010748 [Zalerion maritima]|uniref:Uncharacterized protein n=1 Tax=Zalerion maritima TaxID=339359 RepID=A0AAD5RY55_9PEZI|nr:hypothetical protein MKZ38_010748 [Zalerion maritima]
MRGPKMGKAGSRAISYIPENKEITISVSDKEHSFERSSFIQYVWIDRLDSPCMVCGSDFVDEPSLRTVTFSNIRGLSRNSALKVVNRHLSCLKSQKIIYHPVSHVWDSTVPEAHLKRVSAR